MKSMPRVDYQLSDKQSLFAHYHAGQGIIAVPYSIAPSNVLTAGGSGRQRSVQWLHHRRYVSAERHQGELRSAFTLNRVAANLPGANMFGPQDVGINAYTYQPNYLTIHVTGAFSTGKRQLQRKFVRLHHRLRGERRFPLVHGSHQFAFGGFITRSIEWSVAQAWSGGSLLRSRAAGTGLGLGDFLLGNVSQLRQANPNPLNLGQNFAGLYAQDTWKLTPKLTLNYGVNWDPFFGHGVPTGRCL